MKKIAGTTIENNSQLSRAMMQIKNILFPILAIFQIYCAAAEVSISEDFECGSLGEARRRESPSQISYSITTKVDPQNPVVSPFTPSNRWFYFMLSGIEGRELALDITFNDSRRALYSYDNRHFQRLSEQESPEFNRRITKRSEHDTIYIAYYEPYTLTRSQNILNKWQQSPHLKRFTIGKSEQGREMEMILLSKEPHQGLIPDSDGYLHPTREDRRRKIIYIHSRIHPSESPASWHLEALIDELLYERDELLDEAIFYILPIANPDGVAGGYSRSNARGIDLEGNYNHSPDSTAMEVSNIKRFITTLCDSGMAPTIALNLHAQSAPKASYWIHSAESAGESLHSRERELASLTTLGNRHFTMADMQHSTLAPRYLEGWLNALSGGQSIAITHELPYSYYCSRSEGEWVDRANIAEQAHHTLAAVASVAGLQNNNWISAEPPRRAKGFHRRDGELVATAAGAEAIYHCTLHSGTYHIYMRREDGSWQRIGRRSQRDSAPINYRYRARQAGERLDEIMFVRVEGWCSLK